MRRRILFLLPLLAALVVGASFAGCIGSGSSSVPTPTPHPSKALVGFGIGFKVFNFTFLKNGSKTWKSVNQAFGGYCPLLLMVQPYLIFPNGTKVFMLTPYERQYGRNCFYVIGFNRTQGWHGPNYWHYKLPLWGNTTFYFSTIWNKTTFYQKVLPLLRNGTKIELRMGIAFPTSHLNDFSQALEYFTGANPPPVISLNWTPGQNLTKAILYEWTVNIKETGEYGCKCKMRIGIWVKPVYWPWGQYPSSSMMPWKVSGNDYNVLALVGFVIGFKVINFTILKNGSKTWESLNQMFGGYYPLLLMVQPYLVYPNGTKVFMLTSYEKSYWCNCFYVIGFNRTQGWHGPNYWHYLLPMWGSTKFYFSTIWNKTTFYKKILPLLEKGAKIELKLGITTTGANVNNFTEAVKWFTTSTSIPLIYLNWTPGQNLTKTFVYSWTANVKGTRCYNWKFKVYLQVWIKPIYLLWGLYPSPLPPWLIRGNIYDVWP